jgi:hypothetical protein
LQAAHNGGCLWIFRQMCNHQIPTQRQTAALQDCLRSWQRLAPALLPWMNSLHACCADYRKYRVGNGLVWTRTITTSYGSGFETELLQRLVIGLPERIKLTQALNWSHFLHKRKFNTNSKYRHSIIGQGRDDHLNNNLVVTRGICSG